MTLAQKLLCLFRTERHLLYDHNGNANKRNHLNQTSLHCLLKVGNEVRRNECLTLLLKWKDKQTNETIDIDAKDSDDNTALHHAAKNGLKSCVESLLNAGAALYVENHEKLTPCELAEKNGHKDLAIYLESKMIFSNSSEDLEIDELPLMTDDTSCGLRIQDLQEAKDLLLVETADMLQLPLFTAEALLRHHEWSKESLLQSWIEDPIGCCEISGVNPPLSILHERGLTTIDINDFDTVHLSKECEICLKKFESGVERIVISCDHQFCKECWQQYLTFKIQEGSVHTIFCPAVDCFKFVPNEIIEKCVDQNMARRYLQFDIKAFVDSNPNFKWCPHSNCALAVQSPIFDRLQSSHMREFSKSVNCRNGHYFCWDCLLEGHEPASCENWKDWFDKVAEIKPEELKGTEEEEEIAANCLWLVTNSKKCPNCSISIQKNEGCNHIKCVKCKYDFCWICLEAWKKHSSTTGGYFQCNRYETVNKIVAKEKELVTVAEQRHLRMVELNKFVHYYTRFKNHENSYKFEEPLSKTAKEKCEVILAKTNQPGQVPATVTIGVANDENNLESQTKFIEDAIKELLRARRVLRCSYVYGYYLENSGHKKMIFEFIQTEFEECTETLSQIIARPYLRTPKHRIVQVTKTVKRKRLEFLETIARGLIPPDTPPSLKKFSRQRWKYLLKDDVDGDDDELKKAIAASLKDLDPKNPWVVDRKGRHTNLVTLLNEWPELEMEMDSGLISCGDGAYCKRRNCFNHRARNSITTVPFDYCSLKCLRLDRTEQLEGEEREMEKSLVTLNGSPAITSISATASLSTNASVYDQQNSDDNVPPVIVVVPSDGVMDLLRAIEMSRLQAVREHDQNLNRNNTNANNNASNLSTNDKIEYFNDLQEAIELSIKSKYEQESTKEATVPIQTEPDEIQSMDVAAVVAIMPSLDLFIEHDADRLSSLMMNLQPTIEKDHSYENSKIMDFAHKHKELKETLQKPDELKEYEDFDLKCIETSFHQQQTELKRKLSNKKNKDATLPLMSNDIVSVAAAAGVSLTNKSHANLQRKRSNRDADIRPCEPNERFDNYRSSVIQHNNQQNELQWFNESTSMSTTRVIVERRPLTPSDDESSFA
ncbi:unnamed protein product [Rotaria magnacalcarata]|uniref:RBR-type E3 ubiquitin transferase n=2 Tax=Rotaria magnacalcarata TaxID=392030 RepID=A0A816CSE0_9BILA|nr:unnamed protein product [Rotaria magnacalcarata]CAF3845182.1 unnamed protein product [Rotaria magnacalcarata]CAF3902266.1 unnamed protein product [Rotaria magnacalcarata]